MFGPNFTDPTRRYAERHGYVFEVPLRRRPRATATASRCGRWAASCTRRSPPTTAAGSSTRPRTPARAAARASTASCPRDRHNLRKGGRLQILGIKGSPQYDAREGQRRGRPLPVTWIDIPDPDPEYLSEDDPARHLPAGLARRRVHVQPPRGLLGRRRQHLLRLHQRRRRQERRRQRPTATARATGRSGSTASARARSSCTTSRRAGRSWTRPTTSPSRRAAGCSRARTTPPRPTTTPTRGRRRSRTSTA